MIYLLNQLLWLDWEGLQQLGGLSFKTIDYGCGRYRAGKSTSWQNCKNPNIGSQCLVQVDSLPTASRAKLPSTERLLKLYQEQEAAKEGSKQAITELFETEKRNSLAKGVVADELHVQTLMTESGKSRQEAERIARLAAWYRLIDSLDKEKAKSFGFGTKEEALTSVMAWMKLEAKALRIPGVKTPGNARVLLNNARKWRNDGLMGIVSKKEGNTNAEIFDEVHRSICFGLYSDSSLISKKDTHFQYTHICREVLGLPGEEIVSYGTVKRYLGLPETEAAYWELRFGTHNYNLKRAPHNYRVKPNFALSLVSGDGIVFGETVLIEPPHPFLDPKTTKPKRGSLTCWVWYDWFSGAIVGYKFGLSEDGEMIRLAFRNILKNTGDRCPLSIHIDTKWSKQNEVAEVFERAGVYVEKKKPYNPNESMAERLNKELAKFHRILSERWINITNHNINFVRKGHQIPAGSKMRPVDEAMRMFMDVINLYNHFPQANGLSRWEVLESGYNPNCKVIDALDRTQLFGLRREEKLSYGGDVSFEICGVKYIYRVPHLHEVETRIGRDRKVAVVFDEEFMERVDIYKPAPALPSAAVAYDFDCPAFGNEDVWLTSAERLNKYNPARVEQTEADKAILSEQEAYKARYQRDVAATRDKVFNELDALEIGANPKQYGQDAYKAFMNTEQGDSMKAIALQEYEGAKRQAMEAKRAEKTRKSRGLTLALSKGEGTEPKVRLSDAIRDGSLADWTAGPLTPEGGTEPELVPVDRPIRTGRVVPRYNR